MRNQMIHSWAEWKHRSLYHSVNIPSFNQSFFDGNLSVIGRSMSTLVITLIWLYLLCNAGEEVTNRFLEISDSIYECPWNNLPHKLRKYIPRIIAVAQRPVYMQGMGNIRCTRETYKTVRKLKIATFHGRLDSNFFFPTFVGNQSWIFLFHRYKAIDTGSITNS